MWIVVEPDMCIYEIDAVSRLELLQSRMPEEKFKDYEAFGNAIDDPNAKEIFFQNLEQWRNHQKVAGLEHVPWPAGLKKPADPVPLAPWHKPKVFPRVESVPSVKKA